MYVNTREAGPQSIPPLPHASQTSEGYAAATAVSSRSTCHLANRRVCFLPPFANDTLTVTYSAS